MELSKTSLSLQSCGQGSRESSRGPGQIYVVTALIQYWTVLLEYIDLFGTHEQSGAQLPPPLSAALPVACNMKVAENSWLKEQQLLQTP